MVIKKEVKLGKMAKEALENHKSLLLQYENLEELENCYSSYDEEERRLVRDVYRRDGLHFMDDASINWDLVPKILNIGRWNYWYYLVDIPECNLLNCSTCNVAHCLDRSI